MGQDMTVIGVITDALTSPYILATYEDAYCRTKVQKPERFFFLIQSHEQGQIPLMDNKDVDIGSANSCNELLAFLHSMFCECNQPLIPRLMKSRSRGQELGLSPQREVSSVIMLGSSTD